MTVGLFVTCLADCMRPQIAQAALQLLRLTGAAVDYVQTQTCCGQIAFNSGYDEQAKKLAQKCAAEFAHCERVVMPSGSCCHALRHCIEELFPDDAPMLAFSRKCMELSQYLQQVNYAPARQAAAGMTLTFHDSCSGLRGLGIKQAPRRFLRQAGYRLLEMEDCEECCGFGGRFATQFAELSVKMAQKKCERIIASGAQAVAAGDLGCLLHIQGRLQRNGCDLPVYHWAQLLV